MAKATIPDIAQLAGVGTATVERVLNGRGGVRPATVEKVIAAARQLDYPRRLPDAHRGLLRIEVLLVRPETTFYARIGEAFARVAATLDKTVSVQRTYLDEHDTTAIAARIGDTSIRRAGLIAAVPNHPLIHAALQKLQDSGVPVVQLLTDPQHGVGDVVGIDHYAAGRTAAMLMTRMERRAGPVVALCHSPIYKAHRDRIRGFSDYMQAHGSTDQPFVHVLFGHDQNQRSGDLLLWALRRWPDMAGFYNAGGANAAITDVLRRKSARPFFVGHELTERSAAALRSGEMSVVLDQGPEAQAQRALSMIIYRIGLSAEVENPPIRFHIITPENI